MKNTFSLFLLLLPSVLMAQDTLYLDGSYNKVLPEDAIYYRIVQSDVQGDPDLLRKTFWVNGQIKSERNFLEKDEKLTAHGISKFWYKNGQLFYTQHYRKGKRHGELKAYWEDGTPRRRDTFKKGKLKSGKVWDRTGKEVPHFPVMVPAMFPGGQQAISAYLKKHLPVNPKQQKNTEVKVVVSLVIDKEGFVSKVDLIEGAPHWYNAVTLNALLTMPRWNPGEHMGEPVNVRYTLPITFRK